MGDIGILGKNQRIPNLFKISSGEIKTTGQRQPLGMLFKKKMFLGICGKFTGKQTPEPEFLFLIKLQALSHLFT